MLPPAIHFSLIPLACILMKSCLAFKNDATEILYSHVVKPVPAHPSSNSTMNQARNGGRHFSNAGLDRNSKNKKLGRSKSSRLFPGAFLRQLQEARVQVGCRELRSTKYISDGQCTSISPLKELVCAGECLPLPVLPNWIGGGYGTKYWSRRSSQEWRCVNDKTRTQRIQLQCQDGSTRTYKITVVTACKCKRYTRQHNESSHNFESLSPAKPAQHQRERKRAGKPSKHSMS
ncbi:Sclerostin domain-containing protein 1 [Bos mutus]|uniref:Sclerostin domain-containing protein 1 n=1 Tax=Bos mutus TaxID=72004 RepID=L8IGF9_9CETA|nr:Sclerostin domain-containing protein 1 [Bos mutus]